MRAALTCAIAIGLVLSQPSAGLAQGFYEDAVKAVFQNAIVKVEVSVPNPVIRDGKNICVSQGTGFFITSSHVITAAHVFTIPTECGPPTIILASHYVSKGFDGEPQGSTCRRCNLGCRAGYPAPAEDLHADFRKELWVQNRTEGGSQPSSIGQYRARNQGSGFQPNPSGDAG